ncbi:MAG: hypothetical protein BRC55_06120 [Cyanobacteria bacterium SW_8_48_13]|nr:MAG: hypothetical protein BRC55_06120 [Cyanobacteria bacterium SW_8_48_13]
MVQTLLNRLGEVNPQLFREFKGRLKPRNLAIAAVSSVLAQVLLYLFFQTRLSAHDGIARYCQGAYSCNSNWQLWWLDLFVALSLMGMFALLVVGTYLLIRDIVREERRGTLGFIRLSPQSAVSILIGKMLGVPALLYVMGAIALPLHLGAGLAAQIPLSLIFSFYAVLAASCAFSYSAALLFGLVSARLGEFQAWLGSSAVLFYLCLMTGASLANHSVFWSSADWLTLFYPGKVLPYLVGETPHSLGTIGYFNVLNYGLWSYWIWQGLKRRFSNPRIIILSKQQSYGLSGSFALVNLGFVFQPSEFLGDIPEQALFMNFATLLGFELLLFLGLIAALSPHRQTLQDWARYRHRATKENRSLLKELIRGDKSPSTVAIALNLAITSLALLPAILFLPLGEYRIPVLFGVVLNASLILIYAMLTQSLLLMKMPKRETWAAGVVSALVLLPLVGSAIFIETPGLRLFSAGAIFATSQVPVTTVFFSILGQWLAIALLGLQMKRQLQKAGESTTKALLSGKFEIGESIWI